MGKKKGSPVITQATEAPWGPQVPHLGQIYATAYGHAFDKAPDVFYPGTTVAGFSPQELAAMQLGENRARQGSESTKLATDYARGILSNDPETLRNVLGPRVGELLPQLQSQFNRAGMGTSSLARSAEQELIARELSKLKEDAANRLERLGPQEYYDISKLAGIGEARRGMEQSLIDEQIRRHEFAQQEPWDRLGRYQAAILGHWQPSESNQRSYPMAGSRLSGLLGGGLGGAVGASSVGLDPLLGGILGGLGGFF